MSANPDARRTVTPGPAESDEMRDPGEHSRRGFLKMGVGALSLLATLEVGGASVLFVGARDEKGKLGGVVEAGLADSFPPGSVTEFPGAGFFLVRAQDGGFLAVHRRCPHLGCTVYWSPEEEHFVCPCHGSSFDFYGSMENPPVPRPLDLFAVTIEDALVKVDTMQTSTRERFEPGQLAYGQDSFPIENTLQGQDKARQVSGG